MKYCVVTPWHNPAQRDSFLEAWGVKRIPDWLILQQDKDKSGCAKTKNAGIYNALFERDAEVVIVLDDDCYPVTGHTGYEYSAFNIFDAFIKTHLKALEPQPVKLYEVVTDPPSRGTPYFNRTFTMPVAATMGFWYHYPDFDAASQLVHKRGQEMVYKRQAMFYRFFPFSGMNCAFRADFWPHFKFDETADRFDDIFMGYNLQNAAYRRHHCINLNGPSVHHMRQSNVWSNLKIEAGNLERNETEWQRYAPTLPEEMRKYGRI